jgi:cytochrome c553
VKTVCLSCHGASGERPVGAPETHPRPM